MNSARLALAGCVFAISALTGCAGDYVARTRGVRASYENYDHQKALEALQKQGKDDEVPEIDRLLYLLDKGMLLHASGQYLESVRVLAEADKLSQELDFTSVGEEAAVALTNERERAYRGEDFEKLMVSVLQALNFKALGKDEAALVEVRRVNERIKKMISEEKKPYEQLAIARYLGGAFYEDEGNVDSALIDYQDAFRLNPNQGHLAEAPLRLAKEAGRQDFYNELRARYPEANESPLGADEGQILVVAEMGLAPEKQTLDRGQGVTLITVPVFRERWQGTRATARVGSETKSAVTVTDLQDVAVLHLEDRVGKLVARQVAAMAVKGGVAVAAGALTKSEEVGLLTFYLLSLLNQPDLRSWLSLPAEWQLARFRVPAGKHQVEVEGGGRTSQHAVEVRPRRLAIVVVRRY